MELRGKYGTAIVYNELVEEEAISQIISLLNQPMAEEANIRIMPDVHAGAGCVIGYTAKLKDKIVPNLIGVDIGCGINAWKLGPKHEIKTEFEKLDKFIKKHIPSGRNVNTIPFEENNLMKTFTTISYPDFIINVRDICLKTNQKFDYVINSLGTLGGGNHFIEIDEDDKNNLWLVIHSGSRNFGLKIAKHHQNLAVIGFGIDKDEFKKRVEEIKKNKKGKGIEKAIHQLRTEMRKPHKTTGLEFLEGSYAINYFSDMSIAQVYAQLNRRVMGYNIIKNFYKLKYNETEMIESVHNYINFNDKIIRKGSISAHKDEKVVIPLNMADGVILGIGKGNEEWNYSAPHGAGRTMSRSEAKRIISLENFQKIMNDKKVWSSCISKNTLDESPQAYKKADHIIEYLKDTVDITCHMKPVYNFKAGE